MKKNYFPKKILQIMRISFLLLFACFINISASIYSQKFSFSATEDKTIKDILTEIESKSNIKFLYRTDLVDVSHQIKLDISDADISTLLSTILDPSEMTYRSFFYFTVSSSSNLPKLMIMQWWMPQFKR